MRTTYNGGVEGFYQSLPFGDGQATTGADTDANHYAQLDLDAESGTAHAQQRQDSNAQGRWLSPDPYHGSYQTRNPQSFNRYVYAGNNPLAAADPSGLIACLGVRGMGGRGSGVRAMSVGCVYDGPSGSGGGSPDEEFAFANDPYNTTDTSNTIVTSDGGDYSFNSDGMGDPPDNLCPDGCPAPATCGLGGCTTNDPQFVTVNSGPLDEVITIAANSGPADEFIPMMFSPVSGSVFGGGGGGGGTTNNASVRATPTPPQQSWWTKYAAQLGCEAYETVNQGEEIVTAYGLSILAGGGGAYKTSGAFFVAGASLQLGIRETCVHEAWGSDYF